MDERESIVKRLEWGGAGGSPPRCWTVVPIFIKIFIFNRKNKNLGEKMSRKAARQDFTLEICFECFQCPFTNYDAN